MTISVIDGNDIPISGAKIVTIESATGKTHKLETSESGVVDAPFPSDAGATVFVAHPKHLGWEKTSSTFSDNLVVKLKADEKTGSYIFEKMPTALPGFIGTLRMIIDQRGQLFLFSDQLALNRKSKQLLKWELKREIEIADTSGGKGVLTVVAVKGGVALLELTVEASEKKAKSDALFLVVDRKGAPVTNATVVLVNAQNKTNVKAKSNALGEAVFNAFPNEPVVVLCGHPDFRGFRDVLRQPFGEHRILLNRSNGIGSVVFPRRTGHIPGFEGRLNPILDSQGRHYIYGTNIALEGGKQQPVKFSIGRQIQAVDAKGTRCKIIISELIGDTSQIEYVFL